MTVEQDRASFLAAVREMDAAKRNNKFKAVPLRKLVAQRWGIEYPQFDAKLLTQERQVGNRLGYELPQGIRYLVVTVVDETNAAFAQHWIEEKSSYSDVRAVLLLDGATPRTLLVSREEHLHRDGFVQELLLMFRDSVAVKVAEALDRREDLALTVEAVRAECEHLVIDDSIVLSAVAALLAGKNLILVGPPGTGKTELAQAICRAAVGDRFRTLTATSDWSVFQLLGGYVPDPDGEGLVFQRGLLLEALNARHWVLIDELNRADLDKSFGPLLTLLSNSADDPSTSVIDLPFEEDEQVVNVGYEGSAASYQIPNTWRIVATLNLYDKASLFQLSYAFMRRFAFIHVDVPAVESYRKLIEERAAGLELADDVVEYVLRIALGTSRKLGPAVSLDVLRHVAKTRDLAGAAFDWRDSLVVAAAAYVVPQFEGSSATDAAALVAEVAQVGSSAPVLDSMRRHLALVTGHAL